MADFRLQVFYTAAQRLNFTKAAEELFITQPAVTRHIRELEAQYQTRLFERQGARLVLTPAGKALLTGVNRVLDAYRKLDEDMAALQANVQGSLRIGASSTAAQYVLPPVLARFREKYEAVHLELTDGNTEQIEAQLLDGRIDLGVVEGQRKRRPLKYLPYLKDELVLCARVGNPLVKTGSISLKKAATLPLLLREPGSGTLEVLLSALKQKGIARKELNAEMILHSTESIKSWLLHSDCFAFVSIHAILPELKNNLLAIVDIQQFSVERMFHLVRQQGEAPPLTVLAEKFLVHNARL